MMNQEMIDLAKALVEITSINGTAGERQVGEYIENYFRKLPYFQKYPERVITQELKDDALHRKNVFAILIGEGKQNSGRTILLHGHIDTVGLEGYGDATEWACKPDELPQKLIHMELPDEVRADLESGEYMFGRGACDMKSGDAVFMEILKEYSEHAEDLNGNIIVSLNPVEENTHAGIINGLEILAKIKETYGLEYTLAINNDYICPLFPGDTVKTIYTGVVGKILPCFYIQGKETHVGQCFEGVDASLLAAELVREIDLNVAFSDSYEGEYAYPPSVLKMKDLKPWYNVQTSVDAYVYFNYFVHNSSIQEITEKLKQTAEQTFKNVFARINEQESVFCEKNQQPMIAKHYKSYVLTYDELYKLAKEKGLQDVDLKEILDKQLEQKVDKREIPIEMIRYMLKIAGIKIPTIVLYYAVPYCPHNTLQGKDEELIKIVEKMAKKTEEETGETYRIMKFFPSLSDSSYLKIDDSKESIDTLINNFPGFEQLYPVPIEQIRKLNIPAINYGCYGKDAHKWTERVNLPYTFDKLPILIKNTINYFLVDAK